MIYLYWYLGIGVAALAVVFGAHRLTKKDEPESLRDLLDAVNPDRKKLSYRLLNNLVVPVVAAVAVIVVWPVAFYMRGKALVSKKRVPAVVERREFSVERGHLQERLSIQEVELRETVDDPLGAVPDLPFGHLNAVWINFLREVGADDELWSFTAPWQAHWGQKEVRSGYVVVRDSVPGKHILVMCKSLESE